MGKEGIKMDGLEISIVINFKFEGIHRWEACPYEDVSFLKNQHRHIFYVKVIKNVSHENRDIEIIKFKRELESAYSGIVDLGNKSCEMVAIEILTRYHCKEVEVLEDGENGANIKRGKKNG